MTGGCEGNRRDPATEEKHIDLARVEIVSSDGTRRSISSTFVVFRSESLIINTQERLVPSTALSVEHSDVLFIGEMIGPERGENNSWSRRIKVKHTLNSLQSLMRLRSALLGESNSVALDLERVSVFG
jgi:hypothetical protein